jgi:membrane fusion protein (multidrug efflux system)
VDKDIISPYELETAKLNLRASEAALTQAKANLANAKINQGYTTVTSPVNGVVGAIPMRLGSYVSSATATPLTTVSDISKIYAYFSINEKQQLDFFKSTTGNTFQQKITQLPAVQLILSDGTSYDINGKVETFSGQINKQTGSFNVRAGFQNPTGILRSGSSAVVRIPTQVNNAIVIPQTATYDIQGKKFTYILNEDNTIKAAPITVRAIPGGKFYVVDEGLTAAQKILIEGAGILTEGTKVIPQLTQRDSVLAVAP